MDLRFGRARANCTPGHQIRDVLGGDHVKEFDPGRKPKRVNFQQYFASESKPPIDIETAIERRVIDQPLPADCCARLFKIDPHDDFEFASKPTALLRQASCVLVGCLGIMNRAGPDDNHHPVIHPVQDAVDSVTRTRRGSCHGLGDRKLSQQMRRGREFEDFADPEIVGNRGCHKVQEKDSRY